MSISGINNYNYQNYYAGARHNMANTGGEIRGVLSSTSSALYDYMNDKING